MRDYSALSDHDFELLIADLFSELEGKKFGAFRRGADGGVDLRFETSETLDVVQCKHYLNSSFSQLNSSAKKEVQKLQNLSRKPTRYRLVTSRELTFANKIELKKSLSPYIASTNDVLGAHDLELLLNDAPGVERRHLKLWLRSNLQLQQAVQSGIWARSRHLLSTVENNLPKYVPSMSFEEASALLAEKRVLVISGQPGVGKTTLAHLLLAEAALSQFELIEVSRDIEEAFDVYDAATRQVFYYDDFLGSTFLQTSLNKNEEHRLASFIDLVLSSNNSLFVMTTREHILSQAAERFEEMHPNRFAASKYMLRVGDYTLLEKARILYNHLWASKATDAQGITSLRENRAYLKILDHANYNPRLIEFVARGAVGIDGSSLLERFVSVLDDPSSLWSQAFRVQLNGEARDLLLLIASLPDWTLVEDISRLFRGGANPRSLEQFSNALRVLDDAFISSRQVEDQLRVNLINPSIEDFLKSWMVNNVDRVLSLIDSATYFDQLEKIKRTLMDAEVMTDEQFVALGERLSTKGQELIASEPLNRHYAVDSRERFSSYKRTIFARLAWVAELPTNNPNAKRIWVIEQALNIASSRENLEAHYSFQLIAILGKYDQAGTAVPYRLIYALIDYLFDSPSNDNFDDLARLQTALPTLISRSLWADVKEKCANLIDAHMDNIELFSSDEDWTEIQELAESYGIYIPDDKVEEIEYYLSAGDEMEQVSPDHQELKRNSDEASDGHEIDAMFDGWDRDF